MGCLSPVHGHGHGLGHGLGHGHGHGLGLGHGQASGNWDHNHPKLVPQSTCSKRRDPGVDYHPGVVRRFEHVDCLQVATSDAVGQDVIIGTIISQSKQVVIGTIISQSKQVVIGTIISQSKQVVIGTIISQSKQVIFGMNGVKIKRHGLILWENDATWLKIILEWFPGPNNLLKNNRK